MIASKDLEAHLRLPSPLQKIRLLRSDREIYLKRDDLIHPWIPGNKWRKLKYHLMAGSDSHATVSGIISFGGAFSNHIHATAAVGKLMNVPTVGLVRGEAQSGDNPTLSFCQRMGMSLHFIERSEYRLKEASTEVQSILATYPNFQLVGEGGQGVKGARGVAEICDELGRQLPGKDAHLYCATGTGTTYAGIYSRYESPVIGINVLKNNKIEETLATTYDLDPERISILNQYHRGGYAKYDDHMMEYIHDFYEKTDIILDHVYMAKLMLAVEDLALKELLAEEVIVYHSGGQQGLLGLDYMNPGIINEHILQSLKKDLDVTAEQ